MTIPVKAQLLTDSNSVPIQALVGNGSRTNATAGAASSNAALPTGATGLVIVRCTDYVWLNFGTSGVTATAAATSILCPPGEGVYPIASTATHFAVLRVGAADVPVQVETLVQS
jgi:hypothetical protein